MKGMGIRFISRTYIFSNIKNVIYTIKGKFIVLWFMFLCFV